MSPRLAGPCLMVQGWECVKEAVQVNVLELYQDDGFQPRRVASTNGGEWAGPCPLCGGGDRFLVWPNRGKEGGSYWCRQCNIGGDVIQYCRDVRKMSFPEACLRVGRELPGPSYRRSVKKTQASTMQYHATPALQQETSVVDPGLWQARARTLVDETTYNLWHYQQDRWLKWLTSHRGLHEETVKEASLGVMLLDRWPEPQTWGLAPEFKEDGRVKRVWLAQGHTIPLLEGSEVLRIKFRRPKSAGDPRYLFLRGSSPQVRVINPHSLSFVIVENELDGLLVAQEGSSLGIGVIALGSASVKPGSLAPEVQAALKNSSYILISLDFDPPKDAEDKDAWAGGKAARAWLKKFPQAHRWLPVKGKDVTEMWQAGVSIKAWLEAGIERAIKAKEAK